MDPNSIVEHGRARFEHAAARRLLKEKYQTKLVFGHEGGLFRAAPEMISLLSLYGDDTIVVQDLYENPVRVNAQILCDLMKMRWQEQMTAWLVEFENLSSKR